MRTEITGGNLEYLREHLQEIRDFFAMTAHTQQTLDYRMLVAGFIGKLDSWLDYIDCKPPFDYDLTKTDSAADKYK